jgi:hypothetical protein
MMLSRTLAFLTLVIACSRDDTRRAGDSLPDTSSRGFPADTMNRTEPDTSGLASGDTTALTGSQITVERAVVSGVLWGASEDDAGRLLGAPQTTNTVWDEALGDSATVLQYPGMTVRLVERRVVGVHCSAATCITGDAVRIGASRAELEQVYGKGQEEKAGPDGQLAYPFTTDNSCALRFELRRGKVSAIDMSCRMN